MTEPSQPTRPPGPPNANRTRRRLAEDDRGVSEVIAFILVFVIILGSVGILYMAGFSSLQNTQETEQLMNAERAMESLVANLNDVQRHAGIEERAGELNLRGGTLEVESGMTNVTVNDSNGDEVTNVTDIQALTYSEGDTEISYHGGALFGSAGGDSVDLRSPAARCAADSAVMTIAVIDRDEVRMTTDGTVEVTAVEQETETYRLDGGNDANVTLEDAAHAQGWQTGLERNGWDVEESGDDLVVTCDGADRMVVRLVTIDLEFA